MKYSDSGHNLEHKSIASSNAQTEIVNMAGAIKRQSVYDLKEQSDIQHYRMPTGNPKCAPLSIEHKDFKGQPFEAITQ